MFAVFRGEAYFTYFNKKSSLNKRMPTPDT